MKALSLTQPWATLIAVGAKRIETRSWSTSHHGLIAIHAAKGFPKDCQEMCDGSPFMRALDGGRSSARYYDHFSGRRRFDGGLPLGAIIATAKILNVRPTKPYDDDEDFGATDECAFGDYSPGRFAWILDDVAALPVPIPCKGALGLWEVPAQIYEAVTTEPFGPRLDHYFTKDGFYDGGGGAVTCGPKEGHAIIEAMEAKRDIDE